MQTPCDKPGQALPRGPVLGWSSFKNASVPRLPSIENLPHQVLTTSGRAAIYHALLQLALPPQSIVLVPTYHCPTMIAPVLLANHKIVFYGLGSDGLPNLSTIDAFTSAHAKAILVSHYFGFAKSLAQTRRWCDEHGVALIEDCAHCYFGEAGERQVGSWGDYATASLSKFLPVPEGGILASSTRHIANLSLRPQGAKAELKGWIDVMELAAQHQRLTGINRLLQSVFWLKKPRSGSKKEASHHNTAQRTPHEPVESTMMQDADMARISGKPLSATRVLNACLPRGRIIAQRQRNFAIYAASFASAQGAVALFPPPSASMAPYVFPLWVDDADRIYQNIREMRLPVFRWDRIWPGTPGLAEDVGPLWSKHVLQLLCHQDLSDSDTHAVANAILKLL